MATANSMARPLCCESGASTACDALCREQRARPTSSPHWRPAYHQEGSRYRADAAGARTGTRIGQPRVYRECTRTDQRKSERDRCIDGGSPKELGDRRRFALGRLLRAGSDQPGRRQLKHDESL
jgi:hypothetical protein